MSLRYESPLIFIYEVREARLKMRCKDSSYDFIRRIAEGDGSKFGERGGMVFFSVGSRGPNPGSVCKVCQKTPILLALSVVT